MKTLFRNGRFYINGSFVLGDLLAEDGVIREIAEVHNGDVAVVYDMEGKLVVPGFIDIHTHGAAGVDVNTATAEDYETICRFFAAQGTTAWLGSVLTDTREQTLWCIEEYKKWKNREHQGAELLGIHLEGPFLSPEYKGAMPEHLLRKGDLELVKEYQKAAEGDVKYITLSPETEGNIPMIPELKKLGIQVAIGHSGADYDTACAAIEAGARGATHTGNAMKLLHQHFPAIWGAVLESDKVFCEIICDGRHLHPGTVRLIIKTKGLDQVVAVTDSIMAAGLPDGNYKLGVNEVVVENGDARLACGGSRAGSTLTMEGALKNLLEYTGRPLREVLRLLTENPARLIGVYDRMGSIEEGKEANLVVLDETCNVLKTYVHGRECR
ncbi:MAG TPA: N-acetylglucosamine-6-phosphate deacetylase [Lachnoclostridium sp.]|jgi:N-acetylglucosamine-6-phosphate deacetylase|uniref:N-acetylglucosamine-6-phosphate deacetylase n=1 Tax=Lacrimispora sp. TaxID=2719234 RepID=UPI000EBBDF5F|nr:N-acetylglucosamine-6-phosphate deacetylase [Lacrimispora sp.]HCD46122.1 N-acetylglucosamine-6-phosphate deacetylase [Lachnoclostridium sp.]